MASRRQIHIGTNVAGPDGVLLAVIATATRDLDEDEELRRDAMRYFSGPVYRHHLELLGLPPDLRPQALRDVAT